MGLFRLLTRKTKKTQTKNIIENDSAVEASDPSEETEIEEEEEEETKEELSNDARDEAIRVLQEKVAEMEKTLQQLKKAVESNSIH